ncbi:uncharacterized protein LOC131685394 [Topomyia yanbarensis]|uniref:uncharacterized protein LOC131685394 n=1 Tax=Topomyia yanbarensis TaxID=2498891 RepID=UPI00273B4E02|nr:uncharacterized protein LOC131685394 [Topomyia yanbarensis]
MSEPDFSKPTLLDDLKQEYEDSFDDDGQSFRNYSDDAVQQDDYYQACSSFNDSTALASTTPEYQMQQKYTLQDLHPTVKDPRCDPNWPLATLWPVFVSNFRCAEIKMLDFRLRRFFASNDLFVRWWFQPADDYYRDFQTRAGLYDMLVYFVSEKDAQQAIERCNRITYEAFTLNVLDGREPVYFPVDRTLYFKHMIAGFDFSQQYFENNMARFGHIVCAVKYGIKSGAVEYRDTKSRDTAQYIQRLWDAVPVPKNLKKQRYLEDDMRDNILQCILTCPGAFKLDENETITRWALGSLDRSCLEEPNHTVQRIAIAVKKKPTEAQAIKIQRRKDRQVREIRRRICRDLRAGVPPRCYHKTMGAIRLFRRILTQIKREKKLP